MNAHSYQPRGGGNCGQLVRDFDWSATSLGAQAHWSPALRTAVDIVLNSPVAMVLMWGPEHVMVYNDGYVDIAGARHPVALGGTVPQVWPELWQWNRAVLEAGFAGEMRSTLEACMEVLRNGCPETVWFDLFYTPVLDGADVGGVLCTVVEVTARVRQRHQLEAEAAALEQANRRLRSESMLLNELFEQSPGFLAVLRGPRHVIERVNQPYLRLVGRQGVIGRPMADALPEMHEQGFIALLDQVYDKGEPATGKQTRVELRPRADAPPQTRYVDYLLLPLKDGQGQVCGILVEGADATDRVLADERLSMAQHAGGIGTFEWFPATGRIEVSPTYRRIWGFSADQEVTVDLLVSLVDERDRAKVGPARIDGETNPLEYTEYRMRRADDGAVRWLARQGEVVAGATPELNRYVGVAFDVTERKQIEQALRASQDRLAAIFGQASVGLSELDLSGRFRRVNGALCKMLGRGEEELLGLHMEEIIHPQDLHDNREQVKRLLASGDPFTLEKRYLKPDGSWVWISSSMSRLDDEAGQPLALISVKTDITERRRIEVALRDLNDTLEQRVGREIAERDKAEEALRQSQKMEAVGQLTGGVAHDFNNVLQIISGNLHLLRQQIDDSVARKRLDMAIAAVERGAKLSSQLLAFARRQPLQPMVSDLGRLVDNMDELLRRTLGETIEIVTVIGSGLWNTLVDPSQIENVIVNLAINARDAMRGEGRLTIEVGNAVLDEYYVNSLVDVPSGQYVMLSVTDNGCGMAPEVLRRAFEPFFTTKGEGEGTGLGLSMAYGFVKQSRGHIKIHSEPGQGTSVKIYLPRSMMEQTQDPLPRTGPVVGGSERVLVVEDDAGVRAVVLDMLEGLGYQVLQAENGQQALQLLEGGAAIDLLFTDVVMPGPLRSTELAQAAREMLPDVAVLFTSGYPQDAIVHGGRLDAGLELLSKPYRREELARKLRHVFNNRSQQMLARQYERDAAAGLLAPMPPSARDSSLRILVVEDNLDSQQMVCELIGMLGHTVSGVGDGEQAWDLLATQAFDILFTDVSLPGMSGIDLARKMVHEGMPTRIIFSTGYGKDALDRLEFPASFLRKPYDMMELKAALDDV
ncbi:MAG: PAS domain S-box protein [Pseudomonadota bacterium]